MSKKRKLRVGVLFGGRSGEHEVSLASARSIMGALDPTRYEVVPIGITRSGRWLTAGDPMQALTATVEGDPKQAPSADPGTRSVTITESATRIPDRDSRLMDVDVVFPMLHGPYGEDGTVQGLLELAGVPYVGCGVLASAVGMDKAVMKEVLRAAGLPIAPYRLILRSRWEREPEAVVGELERAIAYPVFIKPANLGSSVGITKAADNTALRAGLDEAARYDRRLIVEAGIPNAREIECSVLGNDKPIASVPGEVVPSNEFYDYAAKYLDGKSQLLIPAPLNAELSAQVQALAIAAFRVIDGAGLARVDFLLQDDSEALYVNELNTIPGFTEISMYAKLWEASGLSYAELLDRLMELAFERHAERQRNASQYPGARN